MEPTIRIAETDDEIRACYPVMAELRPNLAPSDFLPLVRRLREVADFRIAYLESDGVKAVAGFRVSEWLAAGRYLEIEDLVTAAGERSRGFGAALFEWLVEHARRLDCDHLRLVSALDRVDAHRFYERRGMDRLAYYFHMPLR